VLDINAWPGRHALAPGGGYLFSIHNISPGCREHRRFEAGRVFGRYPMCTA
jgi:hypothetical protein